jgi:hypothetical protein
VQESPVTDLFAARLHRSLNESRQRRLTLLTMCVATFMMQTDGMCRS